MKVTRLRKISPEEKTQIEQGLRSGLAFTVRRSQILLMRAEEQLTPKLSAGRLRCSDQCVREALHAFNGVWIVEGLGGQPYLKGIGFSGDIKITVFW